MDAVTHYKVKGEEEGRQVGVERGGQKKIRREIESAVLHFHGVTIATAAQEREREGERERERDGEVPFCRRSASPPNINQACTLRC